MTSAKKKIKRQKQHLKPEKSRLELKEESNLDTVGIRQRSGRNISTEKLRHKLNNREWFNECRRRHICVNIQTAEHIINT